MTVHAQPYPWDRVPRLTRADAQLVTSVAGALGGIDHSAAREIAASLLGSTVAVTWLEPAAFHRPSAQAAFVELAGDVSAVCEIPGTVAAWIVERALGGDAKLVSVDAGLVIRDETARGVLAYVMTRLLQAVPGNHHVHSVDAYSQTLRKKLDDAGARCFALTLMVESVPTAIHLWLLEPIATWQRRPRRTNAPLAAQLLLDHAVLSAQLVTRIDIGSDVAAALLIGDVLMLQAPGLAPTHDGYQGTARLAVFGARTHHWTASAHHDRLELRQRHTTGDDRMTTGKIESDGASTTEPLAAVADAPIELSVEIARFTLPLGEIATLSVGDVLLTGRPIGEHVTLRAGSRAIASGELVNVDGAIGVRIVTLAGA